MEIYERIRELRKKHLKMSMEVFGKHLGVSLDVISNIENNRLARPDQKLSLYKLICSEFSVNENWLLNGDEPMFIEPDTFSLDEFARQHGATDLELQIVKTYFDLDADTRQLLLEHFRKSLAAPAAAENEKTVEELEAEYKKSVLHSAPKRESTASNTTNGKGSKKVVG